MRELNGELKEAKNQSLSSKEGQAVPLGECLQLKAHSVPLRCSNGPHSRQIRLSSRTAVMNGTQG